MHLKNVLFVCSQNRLRSPTAEQVFSSMEKAHRTKLQKKFKASLKQARVICLDIPDNYEFMDLGLIDLLKARVSRYLG